MLHVLLQELQPVRRARRRPVRAVPDKEEADRVLSQLKIVIRTNYSNPPTHGGAVVADGAEGPRAARPVGEGTRRDARAHQGTMRPTLVDGLKAAGVKQRHELHHRAGRHVQLLGPDQGPDGAPAQRVRRSTAPTPAACAWPRSTAKTSTTSAKPSPRSCRAGPAGTFPLCYAIASTGHSRLGACGWLAVSLSNGMLAHAKPGFGLTV